jgi:uncharacterized protein (TIGR02271 family)
MRSVAGPSSERVSREAEIVVPIAREEAQVGRKIVETERVTVEARPVTREVDIDVDLAREELEIERVPVNRYVDQTPAVRAEGDVTILPIVEEVVVVEKRLLLKEEVYVRKRRHVETKTLHIPVREQTVQINRSPVEPQRRNR